MRAPALVALLCLAAGLAAAPPASAATVRLVPHPAQDRYQSSFAVAEYTAAPGEANVVSSSGGFAITIRDQGALISAGEGCTAISPNEARCELPGLPVSILDVDLGDAADTVAAGGDTPIVIVDGGPGDDRLQANEHGGSLSGGDGSDLVLGGAGNDVLEGGGGSDELRGAGGDDHLTGDVPEGHSAPTADLIDGGDGADRVSYAAHDDPVVVDLADPAPDGAAGEGDVLRGIEDVTGGRGADVLRGDEGPNRMLGQGGNRRSRNPDRLVGRGGRDVLDGSRSPDTLVGGSGDDVLLAGPGADRVSGGPGDDHITLLHDRDDVDRAACGEGTDRVFGPRAFDSVSSDCEVIDFFGIEVGVPVASRRQVRVPAQTNRRICAITIRVEPPGARRRRSTLARGTATVRGRRPGMVRTRLTAAGRAYLAHPGRQRVLVTVGYLDGRCAAARRFQAGSFTARL